MEKQDKAYSEKAEFYRKDIKQTIEDFENSLTTITGSYADIKEYTKAKEKLEKSKEKLERIINKDNLTKEEEYFIYHELNLQEIFSKYHQEALSILGDSIEAFHFIRDSESSRTLDSSALLAKLLKVPNVRYIDTVLGKTPKEHLQKEFEDQLKKEEISKEETDFLLYKYELKPPQKLLPITEMYKEEVYSKRDALSLMKKLGLK